MANGSTGTNGYRRIIDVFGDKIPAAKDAKTAETHLKNLASKLSKGGAKEKKAAKGLTEFIKKGGAKYFVKK